MKPTTPTRSTPLHRYGHAGGHLRDALLDALAYDDWWNHIEISFDKARDDRWFEKCSPKRRAQWLLGQPAMALHRHCARHDPPGDSGVRRAWESQVLTYAQLSRYLAEQLKDAEVNQ